MELEQAAAKLMEIHRKLMVEKNEEFQSTNDPQQEVLDRFQPIFSPEHLPHLTCEEFRSFLNSNNNHHWSGLHRMGPRICSDLPRLQKALSTLVDENIDIVERLNFTEQSVSGMGKAIISAILLVVFPDKYGVWNSTSEGGLKRLGLWPNFDRGETFGQRYVKINEILLALSNLTSIDLWTIDTLWWKVEIEEDEEAISSTTEELEITETSVLSKPSQSQRFGLERHLHEFLRDNWNKISLGKEWAIYSEPGDEEAGYEYPCDVGRIDLLAKHRTAPRWLVVELKRNQSSDATIGQVLRYMGWVRTHLASNDEAVEGLIISHQADKTIQYALETLNNVSLQLYEVKFELFSPEFT